MSRTNIVIDDKLIRQAIRATGAKSKREVVNIALQKLVEKDVLYRKIQSFRGKLHWEGNLEELRRNRA